MNAIEMDADMRVRTLIALTEELTAIFTKENESIVARQPGVIAPLQDDKVRLSHAYAYCIAALARDRSVVDGCAESLMRKLRALTKIFEASVAEQRALLEDAGAR